MEINLGYSVLYKGSSKTDIRISERQARAMIEDYLRIAGEKEKNYKDSGKRLKNLARTIELLLEGKSLEEISQVLGLKRTNISSGYIRTIAYSWLMHYTGR